ncbi:MAG: hypothetical protein LBL66_05020 [Clostridiales bacterium]|nr:hypothetical protein [Clostridiales bacterium]
MWQDLCKKARFVFCRDCRVARRAPCMGVLTNRRAYLNKFSRGCSN